MAIDDEQYLEEMKKDFFEEAEEMLGQIESSVLLLEKDSGNQDAINEIFRAAHTIKGASATVGFKFVQQFTHALEDSLSDVRDGKIKATETTTDTLLKSLDILTELISCEREGVSYKGNLKDDINLAKSIVNGSTKGSASAKKGSKTTHKEKENKEAVSADVAAFFEVLPAEALTIAQKAVFQDSTLYVVSVDFAKDAEMASVAPIQVYALIKEIGTVIYTNPTITELQGDNLYSTVHYFIASEAEPDHILAQLHVPDMIENISCLKHHLTAKQLSSANEAKSIDNAPNIDKGVEQEDDIEESSDSTENKIDSINPSPTPDAKGSETLKEKKKENSSILRVDSERIDKMLNLVGELTVNKSGYAPLDSQNQYSLLTVSAVADSIRSKLTALSEKQGLTLDENLVSDLAILNKNINHLKDLSNSMRTAFQELDRITNDLRGHVMKIRMVTVGQIFNRIPRIVRDISRDNGKEVDIVISGENTEMDKSVVEDLLDPVIHIVRNSLDHGLEPPEERLAAGKSARGTLTVTARHEGNVIIVKFKDDGRGIDAEKIYNSAIKKGVIPKGEKLTEKEKIMLIFQPGFSTAEKVSAISGRGVGMDVVRHSIEALNGTVTVDTEVGKGTEITLKLPLTLTIVQALLVRTFTETYAMPINSIIETMKVKKEQIEKIENKEIISVRGEVLSVLYVSKVFNLPHEDRSAYYAVIVAQENYKLAIIVDSLVGEQDIVIKALKNKLINVNGIAGAANLGDGTITFILDINAFIEMGLRMERQRQPSRQLHAVK